MAAKRCTTIAGKLSSVVPAIGGIKIQLGSLLQLKRRAAKHSRMSRSRTSTLDSWRIFQNIRANQVCTCKGVAASSRCDYIPGPRSI